MLFSFRCILFVGTSLSLFFRGTSKITLLVSSVALVLCSCSGLPTMHQGSDVDREQRIKTYLDGVVESGMTPGIQYIVLNEEKVLFEYASGRAVVNGPAMSMQTPMMLYSATKLFTAVAVLQLVDQNKIQLDDLLSKYLPDIPYKSVTIGQVLGHRAGIPDAMIGKMYVHPDHEHGKLDLKAMLTETLNKNPKLKFEPGSDVKYSNLGYALLGELIRKVSGVSYETYVVDNILKPLGMETGTDFTFDKFEADSKGYARRFSLIGMLIGMLIDNLTQEKVDGWITYKEHWYFNFPAHGGLITNAPSTALFVQDMLAANPKTLSVKMKSEFFKLQGEWNSTLLNSTHNARSWFYNNKGVTPFYFHEGSAFGYISELRVYPEAGIASVLLVNTTHRDHKTVMEKVDGEFLTP
ncbi:MAG: beta-lactamase family protein [Gammaproteobacteria bacterium]|nr:beta-lactamase family protein [Gammaproteobacteria bacterium]